jgi:hypothetical protein
MSGAMPRRLVPTLWSEGTRTVTGGLLCLVLLFSACVTIGREFPVSRVQEIRIGETTQADVERMFGAPWRVGIEDGMRTWTYGKYRYKLFGGASTQDLVVRFDGNDVVVSYSFNTTEHEEQDCSWEGSLSSYPFDSAQSRRLRRASR